MTEYSLNEDAAEVLEFGDSRIVIPKYQCDECGKAISEDYSQSTGKCADCNENRNQTEGLKRIHTITIYLPDEDRGEQGIVEDIGEFSNLIYEAKSGNHISKMANTLRYGIENTGDISDPDLVTFPPPGEERKVNHMKTISEPLEEAGVPIVDVTQKLEDYPSQKSTDTMEQRIENLEGKIGLSQPDSQSIELSEVDTAVVLDDVVVTGATLSNTARALKNAGVNEVHGLGISRNTSLTHLTEYAELLRQEG